MHVGFQSRVFRAAGPTGSVVVKLIEADGTHDVARRAVFAHRLAQINPAVVGPIELDSALVTQVDTWQAVCYPFVEGTPPSTSTHRDVEAMARTLSELHESVAMLNAHDLPLVAALRGEPDSRLAGDTLIHGDFGQPNLIATPSGLKIIDFDESGRGSIEFELGNSLYMTLFDSWQSNSPDRYRRFRTWFMDAYDNAASAPVDESLVDEAIRLRIRALGRWLADPASAPVGIRTASREWHDRLASFVNDIETRRYG